MTRRPESEDRLVARRIVVVEPVSSGNSLVSEARSLGWDVVVASHDEDDRRLAHDTRRTASEVLRVETNDEAALADAVGAAVRQARVDGIVAGCEFYVPTVARLAAQLGLPGLDPESVDTVRHKGRMRSVVAAAGLAGPRFAEIGPHDSVDAMCARVGFPAVVKATDSSGSIHVSRVDDVVAARRAVQALRTDDSLDLGRALSHDAVIEEYVSGDEFSADGYVENGTPVVAAVTRKLLGAEPFFVELGHLTPADLSAPDRATIVEYAAAVARAVGITSGPFHCELRLRDGQPLLMEIAARLPGDRITQLVDMAAGVSLPRVALAAAVGESPATLQALRCPETMAAGIRFLTAGGAPDYDVLEGWEELLEEPWVVEGHVLIGPHEPVATTQADFRCRIAAVLFSAESPGQAAERWREIGERVTARRIR